MTNHTSKTDWKKKRVHSVTLPSGAEVEITIPNLPALVKAGALPNDLIAVATKAAQDDTVPDDLLERLDEYHRFLVVQTVHAPAIKDEEVNDLPTEDIDMLVQFATRQRDMDAIGHQLGGLETVDSFREFRGLDTSFSSVLG